MKGFLFGILFAVGLSTLAAYVVVANGLVPANADGPLLPGEAWAARTSLHATLRREAPAGANPLPTTDANFIAGIKLYGADCAVCHGVADGKASAIAQGLYQRAPQLGLHGVEDDPAGVTFWKLKHGIRFTGMPAFGAQLSETQIWQMTLFLQHMNRLPAAPERVWRALKNVATISPVQPKIRRYFRR
ncbi:MAG: c-type cytochrome [Candidatus Baltobacteraceae bacterium]